MQQRKKCGGKKINWSIDNDKWTSTPQFFCLMVLLCLNCQFKKMPSCCDSRRDSAPRIRRCTNGCKLTGVFFSKHSQKTFRWPSIEQSQSKTQIHIEVLTRKPAMRDQRRSESELSHGRGIVENTAEIKWRFFRDGTEDFATANCLPQGRSQPFSF